MTKIQKVNENYLIVSFEKSAEAEMYSMKYVNILRKKDFKVTKKYQKGSEVFLEMKKL